MGQFRGVKRADPHLLAVMLDSGSVTRARSGDAKDSKFTVDLSSPSVVVVHANRNFSEVFDSVIGFVAVDMVKNACGKFAVVKKPCNSVSRCFPPKNAKMQIAVGNAQRPGPVPRLSGAFVYSPSDNPRKGIVMKELSKIVSAVVGFRLPHGGSYVLKCAQYSAMGV